MVDDVDAVENVEAQMGQHWASSQELGMLQGTACRALTIGTPDGRISLQLRGFNSVLPECNKRRKRTMWKLKIQLDNSSNIAVSCAKVRMRKRAKGPALYQPRPTA